VVLPTTAQTVSGALAEHEAEIGTVSALTTTSKVVVGAIDEVKVTADDAQTEIGGDMATDYNGSETKIIDALNTLRSAGSTATLDQTYVKRNGTLDMTGVFQLDELGVKVSPNTKAMLFKTGTSDAIRMSIETNGRIGVGKTGAAVAYLFDVAGDLAATKLRYGTEDTDTRYIKSAISTIQTVSSPVKFTVLKENSIPLFSIVPIFFVRLPVYPEVGDTAILVSRSSDRFIYKSVVNLNRPLHKLRSIPILL